MEILRNYTLMKTVTVRIKTAAMLEYFQQGAVHPPETILRGFPADAEIIGIHWYPTREEVAIVYATEDQETEDEHLLIIQRMAGDDDICIDEDAHL